MSFADELRNEPNQYRQEKVLQEKTKWVAIATQIHKIIKEICKKAARENQRTLNLDFRKLVDSFFEELLTYKDYYYEDDEKIYELFFENSKEGQLWEEMRNYFFHYSLGRKSKNEPFPQMFGMLYEDATTMQNCLLPMLEKDGLQVEMDVRKERTTYREEQVYVEYSSIDRIFAGKNGYMKTKRVEDQILYNILIKLSW